MPAVVKFGPRRFKFTPTSVQVVGADGSPATLYDATGTTPVPSPTIEVDGAVTFYAVPGKYRLTLNRASGEPTKHSTTLDAAGSAGGEGAPTTTGTPAVPVVRDERTLTTYTTASLAPNAREAGLVDMAPGYRLLQVQTSRPARVRLYLTPEHRDADAARLPGTAPSGQHGLVLDYVTEAGALTGLLNPVADGYDGRISPSGAIPITVDNLGTNGTVTVTLTYVRTEA